MRHSYLFLSLLLLVGCYENTTANTDSGTPRTDSGAAVDASSEGTDSGTPGTDSGTIVMDSGTADIDSGAADVDSGTADVDAGTADVDSGIVVDAGSIPDSGTTADGGSFQSFRPCPTPGDYVSAHSVSFGRRAYTPSCIVIVAGESVTIPASSVHPRAPSASGTAGNPITAGETDATIVFPSPGFFPYYCTAHATDGRGGPTGMAGVIQVLSDTAGGS
jgi:plastocyanin